MATSFDGEPLARKDYAGKALTLAACASFTGGIGGIGSMLVVPALTRVAINFGSAEYFALMVFGVSAVISLSGRIIVAQSRRLFWRSPRSLMAPHGDLNAALRGGGRAQ